MSKSISQSVAYLFRLLHFPVQPPRAYLAVHLTGRKHRPRTVQPLVDDTRSPLTAAAAGPLLRTLQGVIRLGVRDLYVVRVVILQHQQIRARGSSPRARTFSSIDSLMRWSLTYLCKVARPPLSKHSASSHSSGYSSLSKCV